MKTKILYIEDEVSLGKIVYETLLGQNFDVSWIADGALVMDSFTGFSPDVCVLDIMLPNIDGYTLCRQIKSKFPGLPVIFLTARTETADLVKGFEAGGTDYIKKPFSIEELIVRIGNQLHLAGNHRQGTNEKEVRGIGKYVYSPMRYELKTPTRLIKLSQREQEVLSMLTSGINQVIDRKQMLMTIWGDDSFFNSRNLDVYIRKLREYFSEDPSIEIVTLKAKGYLFLVK